MNNKLLLFVFLCLTLTAHGQTSTTKPAKAPVKEALVFLRGAELTHQVSAPMKQGVNELVLNGLSPSLDKNSIRIKTTKGVVVSSFEYSLEYVKQNDVKQVEKQMKDSIKSMNKEIRAYSIEIDTSNELMKLLNNNKMLAGSQEKLDVAELAKIIDYYGLKANEIQKEQVKIKDAKEEVTEKRDQIQLRLNKISNNTETIGTIRLNLSSPMITNSTISISYYTPQASWEPYYDINIPTDGKNITFSGKATVSQTTGLNWDKVKLTLSASLPSSHKTAPLFSAWFLNFKSNVSVSRDLQGSIEGLSVNTMQNQYVPENTKKNMRGSSSFAAVSPMYIINGEIASEEEFSSLTPDLISNVSVLKDASATSIYGSRGANGVILITTKSMEELVSSDENELRTVYNIDLPYTIAGNGSGQSINLKTSMATASFKHYAVPRLDKEVFLLAEIEDWQKLTLLSGKANITYDETYIGSTMIDASSVSKKLTLTLGVDKRVTVKRQLLKDFSSKKWMGKDVKQEFTYKIIVKNNQNKPINLLLKDQYPMSKQKEIEVELLKTTTEPSSTNEDVGVLNWDMELGAGESKEVIMGFSVKYPKDKPINLY